MRALYNENDPKAAAWLRELVNQRHVMPGVVSETDVKQLVLTEKFTRVHLFAGIGGWDLALNMAGWPVGREVWTGSCPCQPFSNAGKRKGKEDDRHLWPWMLRLIDQHRPSTIFGEQVASKAGREWLAGVRADLEALGYAVGAADLCAAGVSAPHIRQRLYWMAYAPDADRRGGIGGTEERVGQEEQRGRGLTGSGLGGGLGQPDSQGREQREIASASLGYRSPIEPTSSSGGGLGNADDAGPQGRGLRTGQRPDQFSAWVAGVFILCADGKVRRIEPGIFPLADGISARMVYQCALCKKERTIDDGINSGAAWTIPSTALLQSNAVRNLREKGTAPSPAPQRPQPHKQSEKEYSDFVRAVSCEEASSPAGQVEVCGLREDLVGQVEAKEREMLFCEVCQRVGPHLRVQALAQSRVALLRGYGNAIVPQVAATFIAAFLDSGL